MDNPPFAFYNNITHTVGKNYHQRELHPVAEVKLL
jgi:hypothetical protein